MKEGERRSARTMAVGEGPENSLEERRRYGDVNWREAGGDVGSRGEDYYGETTNGLA